MSKSNSTKEVSCYFPVSKRLLYSLVVCFFRLPWNLVIWLYDGKVTQSSMPPFLFDDDDDDDDAVWFGVET